MATVTYRLSTKTVKTTGAHEILVTFYHGRFFQRGKTNLFVVPEYWNPKTQRADIPNFRLGTVQQIQLKQSLMDTNTKLEQLTTHIDNAFTNAGRGKTELPKTWLKDLLHNYNFPNDPDGTEPEKPKSFFDVWLAYIDGTVKSKTRKSGMMVVYRAFQRYCLYKGIEADFATINTQTIADFAVFLETEYQLVTKADYREAWKRVPECRMPKQRGPHSVHTSLSRMRAFLSWASKPEELGHHYIDNNPFSNWDGMPDGVTYGTPYYLTLAERNQLYYFDLSKRPALAVQRDIFVFQCCVGCRVGDLLQFKKQSVFLNARGEKCISYIARKTKEHKPVTTTVPLNAIALEIVARYADKPGDELLPFISDVKYNVAIKKVFTLAGITRAVPVLNSLTGVEELRPLNELASSHLARRTFTGILYKKGYDLNRIGLLSGHTHNSQAIARYYSLDDEMASEMVKAIE